MQERSGWTWTDDLAFCHLRQKKLRRKSQTPSAVLNPTTFSPSCLTTPAMVSNAPPRTVKRIIVMKITMEILMITRKTQALFVKAPGTAKRSIVTQIMMGALMTVQMKLLMVTVTVNTMTLMELGMKENNIFQQTLYQATFILMRVNLSTLTVCTPLSLSLSTTLLNSKKR